MNYFNPILNYTRYHHVNLLRSGLLEIVRRHPGAAEQLASATHAVGHLAGWPFGHLAIWPVG